MRSIPASASMARATRPTLNLKLVPRNERKRSQQQLEQAIRKRVASIPGVDLKVGWNTPIYVALLGNNDGEMNRVIADLKGKVQQIRGVTDVEISVKEGTPALSVRLKPELAAEYGITHAQLGTTLRAMVGGENSGYWLAPDGQNYEVITQLPQANRTIVDDIANLNIATGRSAGRRLAGGHSAALDRDAGAHLQPGEHPSPGPAAARGAVRQRAGAAGRRCGPGGAGARQDLRTAARTALRCRRADPRTAGDQCGDHRRTAAGGDLHLPGAGLAVRQFLPAGRDHGVAAAVDRRRHAGAA